MRVLVLRPDHIAPVGLLHTHGGLVPDKKLLGGM